MINLEFGGHFGRHLGFLGEPAGDFRGLLVCDSIYFSEPVLKKSACYQPFPPFGVI